MVDLMSPAERQQIRDGFRDTMDTYSRTPIVLKKAGISMSRFNEDRQDIVFTDYSFNAICIYGKTNNAIDGNLSGETDVTTVEISVHLDILEGLGLLVNDIPNINITNDLLLINGVLFDITAVSAQGQVDKRQAKANIKGTAQPLFYDADSV